MKRFRKVLFYSGVTVLVLAGLAALAVKLFMKDPFSVAYVDNCGNCHAEQLEGTPLGVPLIGGPLQHGESVNEISRSIAEGFPRSGMPGWAPRMDETEIKQLALYVAEQRADIHFFDFRVDTLAIPHDVVATEVHDFRVEVVATGLDPLPFSIAPLPDGRFLLTEKTRGLSIVSPDGVRGDLIRGTPAVYDDGFERPIVNMMHGHGWMMEVAPHPDYDENGWIFLHYSDRCEDCNAVSREEGEAVSMNAVVRGRIKEGQWVDQESIWRAEPETYTSASDMGAGGRLAFDDAGHVFLSVGIKGGNNHVGVQDLDMPYGKIHRMNDDGTIPADNPFASTEVVDGYSGDVPPPTRATVWSYGHRVVQGLEWNHKTQTLWATEMGPRGGDEINLLSPGLNYGWPLYSKGLNYDGTPVEYGAALGIALDLSAIEQPLVDLTPSPAVSSFVIYNGERFPGWQDQLIVGTLKSTDLFRFVIQDGRLLHKETLLKGFARIRDIEIGPDGYLYVLLENSSGGQIVRLVPA